MTRKQINHITTETAIRVITKYGTDAEKSILKIFNAELSDIRKTARIILRNRNQQGVLIN